MTDQANQKTAAQIAEDERRARENQIAMDRINREHQKERAK